MINSWRHEARATPKASSHWSTFARKPRDLVLERTRNEYHLERSKGRGIVRDKVSAVQAESKQTADCEEETRTIRILRILESLTRGSGVARGLYQVGVSRKDTEDPSAGAGNRQNNIGTKRAGRVQDSMKA